MLLCNDAAGYSLVTGISQGSRAKDALQPYRSQEGVHQPVHLVGWKQIPTLQNSRRQIGDHHKMLLEHFAQDITEAIIIFQAADLGDHSKSLKSFIVQFVYEGEVWVGDNHIGQLLDISQTVRKTAMVPLAGRSSSSPVNRGHTEWVAPCVHSSPS